MMRNPNAVHIDFRDLMGIRELGKILPSNLDMVIERYGQFLVGEWKRSNESISRGQEILLMNLARQPSFTVLIIQGHTDGGVMVVDEFWQMDGAGELKSLGTGADKFKQLIVFWKQSVERL